MTHAPLSPLLLTSEQAQRWHEYLQAYRRQAYASVQPGVERNQTLRLLQGIQGRLLARRQQDAAPLHLSSEEVQSLKEVIAVLFRWYGSQPATSERLTLLIGLNELRTMLAHAERIGV